MKRSMTYAVDSRAYRIVRGNSCTNCHNAMSMRLMEAHFWLYTCCVVDIERINLFHKRLFSVYLIIQPNITLHVIGRSTRRHLGSLLTRSQSRVTWVLRAKVKLHHSR